jgi:predicted small secreted protein
MTKRILIAAALLLAPLAAGACNMMAGFGKDMSEVGDAIEDAAEKSK